mmetsp:Transcript_23704/g.55227  ORF Transcript_23704/g.55227 Transcript_23704/m.55227 type:complete len:206 (+) Transcript_23704:738-1355(+)
MPNIASHELESPERTRPLRRVQVEAITPTARNPGHAFQSQNTQSLAGIDPVSIDSSRERRNLQMVPSGSDKNWCRSHGNGWQSRDTALRNLRGPKTMCAELRAATAAFSSTVPSPLSHRCGSHPRLAASDTLAIEEISRTLDVNFTISAALDSSRGRSQAAFVSYSLHFAAVSLNFWFSSLSTLPFSCCSPPLALRGSLPEYASA